MESKNKTASYRSADAIKKKNRTLMQLMLRNTDKTDLLKSAFENPRYPRSIYKYLEHNVT